MATIAMGTNLFPPSFFCSPDTASRVPKLVLAAGSDLNSGFGSNLGSARFSSFFGNGTGAATSAATGAGRIGSTLGAGALLERAGAVAAAADDPDALITTGPGATGAGATATGFGMATGGSGWSELSSRARRSFCSKAPIWSAMVLSTATWVMVKA